MQSHDSISIREVYPDFTDDQLQQAEDTLRRYVAVMVRIFERVQAEQGDAAAVRLAYSEPQEDLTAFDSSPNIPNKRSKSHNDINHSSRL